jgi:hypothetical protein
MPLPRLTFFCELESEPLAALIDDRLIADLGELNASLSLGILDLSVERARVVRKLNRAGVPVVAWLLLPREQGYWFNLYNAPQALARYREFKLWTAQEGLSWDGVGLDIEPDIREMTKLAERDWSALPGILRRVLDFKGQREAIRTYHDLVNQIRADGYRVDSYQFPFIADERKVGSTFLQRLAGLVDIPVDREVWMLYTSFVRPNGAGLLASYSPEAQSIGLGSTGGGVELDLGEMRARPLTWDELARDLRLAWCWCDDLHIFSLEGCLRQGFIEHLKNFTWDMPMMTPHTSQARVDGWRKALRYSLWVVSNMVVIVLALTGGFLVWKILKHYLKRK